MSASAFPDEAVAFLERLLALSERNPDRTRPATGSPDYSLFLSADLVRRFEERIAHAERVGAVQIRRGKRERQHIIERVSVVNAEALARHLGRASSSSRARVLHDALAPLARTGAPWVLQLLDEVAKRWARGEQAHRLDVAAIDLATEFFALLVAISNDEARGLDGRTFSFRTVGDSKAFDRHASRIALVLSNQLALGSVRADDVWSKIGLERYAHPVHLKGSIYANGISGTLVDCRAAPFASVHPELSNGLRLYEQPTALLTIENFASFNRQVREIDDGSLVVYTGGFASGGVISVLRSIVALLDASVPFFHWGDVDPGGVRIFRFLEESLPRPPEAHLMNRALAEEFGHPAVRDASLSAIGSTDSRVAELAKWLATGEEIWNLEQEALNPVSPTKNSAHRNTSH